MNIKDEYDCNLRLLSTNTNSLLYEIKTKNIRLLVRIQKCLILVKILLVKILWCSNNLIVDKMKNETADVVVKKVVGWKSKS